MNPDANTRLVPVSTPQNSELHDTLELPAVSDSDPAARFEQLIAGLLPDLTRYFARRIQPADAAADCAADTALIMWKKLRSLPTKPPEQRAWAFGIARNVLKSHRRKSSRRQHIDLALRTEIAASIDTAESAVLKDDERRALQALQSLKDTDQELLKLVLWDDFTIQDAGNVMRLTPAAARKRYQRACTRLRNAYAHVQ